MILMEQNEAVSVVIPAAGAGDTLSTTLKAIAAQDYEGVVEIVVAAADEESARAGSAGGAVVVENPSGGTPEGLNLAVEASTGDVIVRVDTHSIIPAGYLSRVVSLLAETQAEVVGGMQVPKGDSFWERAIAAAMSSAVGAGDASYRIGGEAGPSDTVYLGTFRRKTFDQLGGFDEAFSRHQDYEFNHRVRRAGGTVWFEPDLKVAYRPRPSLADLAVQYFQYGRYKRLFSRLHPGALRPRQMAPPALVLGLVAALIGALAWPWLLAVPAAYVLGLVVAGLAMLPRRGIASVGSIPALAVMHLSWGAGFLLGQRSDR